jgi:hypothetical protein
MTDGRRKWLLAAGCWILTMVRGPVLFNPLHELASYRCIIFYQGGRRYDEEIARRNIFIVGSEDYRSAFNRLYFESCWLQPGSRVWGYCGSGNHPGGNYRSARIDDSDPVSGERGDPY